MADTRSTSQQSQSSGATDNRTFPTRVELGAQTREALVGLLNRRLADSFDLYTQTKQAHWNVKGMNFYQLHELFDELAGVIEAHSDTIAERVTALGGEAMGTARMSAQNTSLPEFPNDLVEDRQFVEALAERYALHAANLRSSIRDAEEHDDPATADLFTALLREVEKSLYFLEGHLQARRAR